LCGYRHKPNFRLPNTEGPPRPIRCDSHARRSKPAGYRLSEKRCLAPRGAGLYALLNFPSDADDCPKKEHFLDSLRRGRGAQLLRKEKRSEPVGSGHLHSSLWQQRVQYDQVRRAIHSGACKRN
jgi:hypothetical protein